MFIITMLRPPILAYSEIVTLLESYSKRHNLDAKATPQMAFYGQCNNNKNKRHNDSQGNSSFNSKGCGFNQGSSNSTNKFYSSSNGQSGSLANSISHKTENDDALVCQIYNKRNHTTLCCFNQFNHSFMEDIIHQALAAVMIADTQDTNWFLDAATMDHVTNNPSILHSLQPYTGFQGLMVGNGEFLPITHIGQAQVGTGSCSISLNDVLLVPKIKKDQLSISKLTTDYPLVVEFNGDGFVIKDRATQWVMVTGHRSCHL